MKINCTTLGAWIMNVTGQKVYRNTVHYDISHVALNGNGQRQQTTSWDVYFQAAAVLEYADGGESLVCCGQYCGAISQNRDQSMAGAEEAERLAQQLRQFAAAHNLHVLPGLLEL